MDLTKLLDGNVIAKAFKSSRLVLSGYALYLLAPLLAANPVAGAVAIGSIVAAYIGSETFIKTSKTAASEVEAVEEKGETGKE